MHLDNRLHATSIPEKSKYLSTCCCVGVWRKPGIKKVLVTDRVHISVITFWAFFGDLTPQIFGPFLTDPGKTVQNDQNDQKMAKTVKNDQKRVQKPVPYVAWIVPLGDRLGGYFPKPVFAIFRPKTQEKPDGDSWPILAKSWDGQKTGNIYIYTRVVQNPWVVQNLGGSKKWPKKSRFRKFWVGG